MKRAHPLPYQEFIFNQPLRMYEAPLLRKAVLSVIDPSHVLYHNHLKDGVRWGYPLIQYKSIDGKAAILYLGKGIESIHALFTDLPKRKVVVDGREINLEIQKIVSKLYELQVTGEDFRPYKIINWLPLQGENYETFRRLQSEEEKHAFLKRILRNNVFSFAKGVGWQVEGELKVRNFELSPLRWITFKGVKFVSYDARFEMNAFLPPHIGLGKGVAHNYGVVFPRRRPSPKLSENQQKIHTNE